MIQRIFTLLSFLLVATAAFAQPSTRIDLTQLVGPPDSTKTYLIATKNDTAYYVVEIAEIIDSTGNIFTAVIGGDTISFSVNDADADPTNELDFIGFSAILGSPFLRGHQAFVEFVGGYGIKTEADTGRIIISANTDALVDTSRLDTAYRLNYTTIPPSPFSSGTIKTHVIYLENGDGEKVDTVQFTTPFTENFKDYGYEFSQFTPPYVDNFPGIIWSRRVGDAVSIQGMPFDFNEGFGLLGKGSFNEPWEIDTNLLATKNSVEILQSQMGEPLDTFYSDRKLLKDPVFPMPFYITDTLDVNAGTGESGFRLSFAFCDTKETVHDGFIVDHGISTRHKIVQTEGVFETDTPHGYVVGKDYFATETLGVYDTVAPAGHLNDWLWTVISPTELLLKNTRAYMPYVEPPPAPTPIPAPELWQESFPGIYTEELPVRMGSATDAVTINKAKKEVSIVLGSPVDSAGMIYSYDRATETGAISVKSSIDTTEVLSINSDGNVGIGTTNPNELLDVFGGNIRVQSVSNPAIILAENSSSADFTYIADAGDIQTLFEKRVALGNSLIDINPRPEDGTGSANIRLFRATNTTGATNLVIFKGDGTATANTNFRGNGNSYLNVDSGNVGVGTTSPTSLLEVNETGGAISSPFPTSIKRDKSLAVQVDDNAIHSALFKNISTGANASMRIIVASDDNEYLAFAQPGSAATGTLLGTSKNASSYLFSNIRALSMGTFGNSNVHLSTNNAVRMTVTGAGNVGIGTATPAHLLELSTDDAVKPGGGTWSSPSDRRLKKDIEDFADGLSVVMGLRPVRYKYNGKAGTPEDGAENIGFIAQEIKEVAPYTVSEGKASNDPENPYLNVNEGALTKVLINAMQEQQEQIEALKTRIEQLENK